MIKINYMSTLFVGIDVSSKSNVVYSYDSFLVCLSKTNCTPAKNWTPN